MKKVNNISTINYFLDGKCILTTIKNCPIPLEIVVIGNVRYIIDDIVYDADKNVYVVNVRKDNYLKG